MNVIELNVDFSIKKKTLKSEKTLRSETILSNAYKESGQDVDSYKRSIKKEWSNQSKEIKALYNQKDLVAYEVYSDRKYFLFRNNQNTCLNGKGQLRCIIISSEDYKDFKQNIILVINRIQEILKKKVTIAINYDSSCKLYICNKQAHDIVSNKFYLNAQISKENIWNTKKKKIVFIVVLLLIAFLSTFICWDQIIEYIKSLSLANEEKSKAIISTKISILVNLFTGIYGTVIIEILLLFYEIIISLKNINFTFDIDYDISKNNVEEFNRNSLMYAVGDDLDQTLDITSDI